MCGVQATNRTVARTNSAAAAAANKRNLPLKVDNILHLF